MPGAKKQPYLDGYCRTYWDCGKDGAPHPVCCPPGESFDPLSESCVKSGCNEACPSYFNPGKSVITPGRWQSKTLLTKDERGSKIDRNSVFDCHLSPVGRQMAIENSVSKDF